MWEGEVPAGPRGESSDSETARRGPRPPKMLRWDFFSASGRTIGVHPSLRRAAVGERLQKGSKDGRMPEVLRGRLPDGFAQSA
jgi:hypothetical protein